MPEYAFRLYFSNHTIGSGDYRPFSPNLYSSPILKEARSYDTWLGEISTSNN